MNNNIRLPRALCAAVGSLLKGSHASLDELFQSSGAPGPPPNLSHSTKWKEWLFRAGNDPNVDSLSVLGNVLEEAMDVPPIAAEDLSSWQSSRQKVVEALEESGFRYFRGGRVLPNDQPTSEAPASDQGLPPVSSPKPAEIRELLQVLLRGIRRAMHPLTHRRKGAQQLTFSCEYDVQDLLHALLRPWVADIRPEEFTPSCAGSSTRMDFLLPKYKLVLELKFVRDATHAKRIGDELIVDIAHYQKHPDCRELWCVIYDQNHLLPNAQGLKSDLDGERSSKDGTVLVRVEVL